MFLSNKVLCAQNQSNCYYRMLRREKCPYRPLLLLLLFCCKQHSQREVSWRNINHAMVLWFGKICRIIRAYKQLCSSLCSNVCRYILIDLHVVALGMLEVRYCGIHNAWMTTGPIQGVSIDCFPWSFICKFRMWGSMSGVNNNYTLHPVKNVCQFRNVW
jgi:hypothetical protein